jgi:hypothetical protein
VPPADLCGACGKTIESCECEDRAIVRGGSIPQGEQQNRIVACAGRKGSGKSRLARAILEQCPRQFTYDTMGEHRWIPDSFNEIDQATIYLMDSHSFPSFSARYIPESDDDDETDFAEICSTVYDMGNMLFCVEEIVMQPGISASSSPGKFKRITRLGRHRNLDVLYTTQRLEETPRALTAATDVFILFAHSEPRSLDAISARCGPEIARKVASFKGHEFLIYDVNQKNLVSTVDCGIMIAEVSSPQFKPQLTA